MGMPHSWQIVTARLLLPGAGDQWPRGFCAERGAPLATGLGSGREGGFGLSSGVMIVGMLPPLPGASSIAIPGTLIEGTEPLGLWDVSSTQIDGIFVPVGALGIGELSSATTIPGTAMGFSGWAKEEEDLLGVAGSDRSGVVSVDSSGAFQLASKLTMGRPGLSLTAVGSGRFGLRSFKRILVAARMS
ncbi:hypothetical protein FOXG_17792 [Fusarium oxysporum f. sp. lycopersici 4287]|uniref:Uncharacterized protein n=1 Tax=Fusarium oxysporum f. sp. lycopersici (strain 4287 / CBS 123668 / FGSC 9935 / NRRL 34936) TaxID=426428 RepID=A0A0J9U3Y1_FUSO4|nr:hypothetical protein FOXG_17792 [Fusarium oxysporum f. sp. lycopersici 4287]KNA93597.1 hypothetical protein FOXG_17792 [Fusarium oxysporum f. sp. lycopersici 4287]